MEIDSGSGFLVAYLIKASSQFGDLNLRLRYRSTDNAQALYLWQNRFFGHLGAEGFAGYALVEQLPPNVEEPIASIPWWHFAESFRRPWKADVVVCDAAMGEMEAFAANYVIRLAAEMLKESPIGAFIFRHIGEQRVNSIAYVESRFTAAGFKKYEADGVVVHSLQPVSLPECFMPIGGPEKMQAASEFLNIDRSKLLDSYSFFDFIQLGERKYRPCVMAWTILALASLLNARHADCSNDQKVCFADSRISDRIRHGLESAHSCDIVLCEEPARGRKARWSSGNNRWRIEGHNLATTEHVFKIGRSGAKM